MSVENEPERDAGTVPALKRETILPGGDRGRVATLVAMCSLAGVAVGFGLSTAAMQAASEASRTVMITDVRVDPPSYARESLPAADQPWLGIRFHSAAADGGNVGAMVDQVLPGTPAAAVGMRAGDLIVGYEHLPVHGSCDLFRMVRQSNLGDRPVIDLLRNGRAVELQPQLAPISDETRALINGER